MGAWRKKRSKELMRLADHRSEQARITRQRVSSAGPRQIRWDFRGPARIRGMASRTHPLPDALPARLPLVRVRDGALRLVRAPERRGAWSPEEVAHVLNGRRDEFFGALSRHRDGASVSSALRAEVVDEAISLVVMSRKPIQNEQHLEGAFWTTVRLLLAEHRSGRHSVRIGSRQRVDLELVADQLPAGHEPPEIVEAREQIARAADFMAQLDPFEQKVVTLIATRGIGVKLAARRLGVPTKVVVAATRSADHKLEQIAVIAAAGRMCQYRDSAIVAHARGEANAQREQAAKAHLAACAGCRSAYLEMVREMRQRDYQRRASAAFLPPTTIAGHVGLLHRIVGLLVNHRLPSSNGPGERAAGLLGGGGVAAKAAIAGTAIIVAGAGVVSLTAPALHTPSRSRQTHLRHVARAFTVPQPRTSTAESTPALTRSTVTRSSDPTSASGAAHLSKPGFSYLGGGRSTVVGTHSSVSSGSATSLRYLGGNAPTTSQANVSPAPAAVSAAHSGTTRTAGGQFSP
jgi:DNA-directed RNA polymerase specialized sigma24 family protein